jgi:hypothetical protein
VPTRADDPTLPVKPRRGGDATTRRPPLRSERALRALLDKLEAAKVTLEDATQRLRAVDARVRSWDRSEAFLARRAHTLHDEATTAFAQALDGLHLLLVRLADRGDRTLGAALSSRLRAAGTRKLQARVHRELRGLQRAFEGGGALLSRTLAAFDA